MRLYLQEEDLDLKAGGNVVEADTCRISHFYSVLTASIDVIRHFCDRIPGFQELCRQERLPIN